VTASDEAEALHDRKVFRPRVSRALVEPTEGTGARAAEDHTFVPGLPEHDVDALRFPDRLLIERVAARDDDTVHREEHFVPSLVLRQTLDEADLDVRLDVERCALFVKVDDRFRAISRGRRQEADTGTLHSRELCHVLDVRAIEIAAGNQNLTIRGTRRVERGFE
jgi:hypothetical protein